MKNPFLLLTFAFLFGISTNIDAQSKPFKGKLTYSITYEGSMDPATMAQQPSEMSIVILNNKVKTEVATPGATIYVITNGLDSSVTTLLSIPGMGNFYMPVKKDKILEQVEETPTIEYLEETKTVCGIECKKANYITTDEYGDKTTTVVYYSELVGNASMNFGGQFMGLKGFPMEYTVDIPDYDTKMIYTVSKVETKKVKIKETDFMVTDDYQLLDDEMARQLFGGQQ